MPAATGSPSADRRRAIAVPGEVLCQRPPYKQRGLLASVQPPLIASIFEIRVPTM
jgi:hypothetical protein